MRSTTGNRTWTRGFTLLELLVSFAILSFGILGILRAMTSGMVRARNASDQTTAAMLAQMQLEQLRWDEDLQNYGESEGDFGQLYPGFAWEAAMEAVEQFPEFEAELDVSVVRLTITWRRGEEERRYSVETFLRDGEFETAGEEAQLQ